MIKIADKMKFSTGLTSPVQGCQFAGPGAKFSLGALIIMTSLFSNSKEPENSKALRIPLNRALNIIGHPGQVAPPLLPTPLSLGCPGPYGRVSHFTTSFTLIVLIVMSRLSYRLRALIETYQ